MIPDIVDISSILKFYLIKHRPIKSQITLPLTIDPQIKFSN